MSQFQLGSLVYHTNAEGEIRPAVVTRVHDATTADLTVMKPGGFEFLDRSTEGEGPGHWLSADRVAQGEDSSDEQPSK